MADHPQSRVEKHVADLAARGIIVESEGAPGRWMLAS
jgi:hypothetical protein